MNSAEIREQLCVLRNALSDLLNEAEKAEDWLVIGHLEEAYDHVYEAVTLL